VTAPTTGACISSRIRRAVLRERGHDVLCVADDVSLRGLSNDDLFAWARRENRRIVTENVKDFRPLLLRAEESAPGGSVLFTSSRTFPRSRRNPRPLIEALDAWLEADAVAHRPTQDWLLPPSSTR
jgi:hypothetical protein